MQKLINILESGSIAGTPSPPCLGSYALLSLRFDIVWNSSKEDYFFKITSSSSVKCTLTACRSQQQWSQCHINSLCNTYICCHSRLFYLCIYSFIDHIEASGILSYLQVTGHKHWYTVEPFTSTQSIHALSVMAATPFGGSCSHDNLRKWWRCLTLRASFITVAWPRVPECFHRYFVKATFQPFSSLYTELVFHLFFLLSYLFHNLTYHHTERIVTEHPLHFFSLLPCSSFCKQLWSRLESEGCCWVPAVHSTATLSCLPEADKEPCTHEPGHTWNSGCSFLLHLCPGRPCSFSSEHLSNPLSVSCLVSVLMEANTIFLFSAIFCCDIPHDCMHVSLWCVAGCRRHFFLVSAAPPSRCRWVSSFTPADLNVDFLSLLSVLATTLAASFSLSMIISSLTSGSSR